MPFTAKSGKFSAHINEMTLGTGDKAIKLGGEDTFPFYSFDDKAPNPQKLGIEITDGGLDDEPECIRKYYEGCTTPADMAKKASSFEGVDFICISLIGGDPNGKNKSVDELLDVVKSVADATDLPIVVSGCKNVEKDGDLLSKAAEVLSGRNVLILSAREETYKQIGAAAGLAYKQLVGAETADDINLAKQLNVMLTQLGVSDNTIAMQPGTAAAGYGFEYVISTLDRIRAAALSQDDKTLQMPIVTPIAEETWTVKESVATEQDMPEWGDQEERGIDMEVETAAAVLASGSDAVIMKHPESIKAVAKMIKALA